MAKNNELDEFGFEPIEASSQEDLSEFGFEPVEMSTEEDSVEGFEEPKSSQAEALGRGALQGATFGFSEELGAAALTPIEALRRKIAEYMEGTPENVDKQLKEQGFELPEEPSIYEELRDTARAEEAQSKEDFPSTYLAGEIAGGIAPALMTGGGSTAANVAGAVTKGGLKQAMKEGAKLGAKYGAVSGAGYSEADDLGGLAKDVALGGAIGAGSGAVLPVAVEGAKQAAGSAKSGMQKLLSFLPGADDIKAGYTYGRQGKAINTETVDKEIKSISSRILKNIEKAKKANNMKEVKERLEELGLKVNTKKAINEAIEDLRKIDADDMLGVQDKNLLGKLEQLAGKNIQEEQMLERATKAATKKQIESQSKQAQAVMKGEKKLAQEAIKTGDDLQSITDIQRAMDDLEVPFDTSQGQIAGTKGVFKGPEGDYTKSILSDATEFQPVIKKGVDASGRPVVTTTDLGSGKVSAMVGNIENKLQKDLTKMSVSEVEALRKQLNIVTNLAKAQGVADDPVMGRARQLASELKDLTDKAVQKVGDDELVKRRETFSNIFSAEELLGIDKKFAARGDINKELKEIALGGKLGFEKGFKGREEEELAKKLLGKDIITEADSAQLELLKKINTIMGREQYADNITKAGLYKKATADLPNVAGRAVRQVEKKVVSPTKNAIDSITALPKENITQFASKLQASESKGLQSIGNRLIDAMSKEGMAQSQALWALGQNPAFRELVKQHTIESDQALEDLMQSDSELNMESSDTTDEDLFGGMSTEIENEPSREPAMSDFTREKEGGQILTGYVPKNSSKSGVTIASGLDLGNFDLNKLDISDELKAKLEPYVGLKGSEAAKVAANLVVTEEEANQIDEALTTHNDVKVASKMEGLPEEYDNDNFKEGLESFTHNSPQGAKTLIDRVKAGKIDEAIDKGVEWNKTGGRFAAGLLQRRMEELYKMFPEKADLIQSEGKIEYDKYQDQTRRTWDQINTIEEAVQEAESAIDKVNQQQSSGDTTPVNQLDALLQKINSLQGSPEEIDDLENEAVQMESYADGQRLKEKIRKLQGLS